MGPSCDGLQQLAFWQLNVWSELNFQVTEQSKDRRRVLKEKA